MSKLGKRLWTVGSVLVVGLALLGVRILWGNAWQHITVSAETTHIMAPRRADGTVDYMAALNEKYGQGVTPKNNAAIPLLLAQSIDGLGELYAHELAEALGAPELEQPRARGSLFVTIDDFREKRGKPHPYDPDEEAAWREEVEVAARAPWKATQFPEVAAWLEASAGVLARISAASEQPRFFVPTVRREEWDTVFSARIAPIGTLRTFSEALAARAMLRMGNGDFAGAMADSRAIQRLGLLVGQQPTLIERLVGVALIERALVLDAAIVEGAALTPAEARAMEKQVHEVDALPSLVECLDVHERFETLDQLTNLARFGPDIGGSHTRAGAFTFGVVPLRFDPAMKEANVWADRLVKAASTPTFSNRELALAAVAGSAAGAGPRGSSSPEALRRLVFLFMSDRRGTLRIADYTAQRRDLLLAGLKYLAEREPGKSLETAADPADWVKSVAPDIFRGQPLRAAWGAGAGGSPRAFLLLECAGPEPLPRVPFMMGGRDLSAAPVQRQFAVRVRLVPAE